MPSPLPTHPPSAPPSQESRFRGYGIVDAPELRQGPVEGASKVQVKLCLMSSSNNCSRSGRGGDQKEDQEGNHDEGEDEHKEGEEGYFYPEEISAGLLRHAKQIAEAHVGAPVTAAVVAIPAYFEHAQRSATRAAARLAGFEKVG